MSDTDAAAGAKPGAGELCFVRKEIGRHQRAIEDMVAPI